MGNILVRMDLRLVLQYKPNNLLSVTTYTVDSQPLRLAFSAHSRGWYRFKNVDSGCWLTTYSMNIITFHIILRSRFLFGYKPETDN